MEPRSSPEPKASHEPKPSRDPKAVHEVFRGSLLRVAVEEWAAGLREVVYHPGACAVVALTAEGDVLLVRQFREAVRQEFLEIPAGIYDREGEDGAGCAARELLEETGYPGADLRPLGSIYTSPGFTDERIDLFLARAGERTGPGEEGVEVVAMPLSEAIEAVRAGRITDAKSVCALLLVAGRLGEP